MVPANGYLTPVTRLVFSLLDACCLLNHVDQVLAFSQLISAAELNSPN